MYVTALEQVNKALIDGAIDAGLKKVDLYEAAAEDIIRRENIDQFFRIALAAYLKALSKAATE